MRARAKLFKRSHAVVRQLPSWVNAAHSFLWLHILQTSDLNDITMDSYSGEGRTSFGSEEHNLNGLWDWEKAAFGQCFSGCKSVLVAGAGGGREVIALASMGHNVSGFDASEDLIRDCLNNVRKVGVTATIQFAPPGEVPSGHRVHDALVIGRGVYHHIPGRRNRIRFLTACREQIKDDSPVFLGDFLIRTNARHRLTAFSPTNTVERGDSIGFSFFHYFTHDEIRRELDLAGFELVEYRITPFPGGECSMAHVLARSKS